MDEITRETGGDVRIILQLIVKILGVLVWTRFKRIKIRSCGGLL
jgi:hypothetical protein